MKWIAWFFKMALTACVFTAVSLYATFTAVQVYINKVLAHYQIGVGMQSIEFSDFLAEIGTGLNIMKQPTPQDNQALKGGGDSADSGTTGNNVNGVAGQAPVSSAATPSTAGSAGAGGRTGRTEATEKTDAMPVWNQGNYSGMTGELSSGEQTDKKMIVSTESLRSTKDKLSADDKMKLFSLLVSKLPAEEVQTISRLMEDGITQDELVRMDTIVQSHVTKEEYKQLLDILGKYQ